MKHYKTELLWQFFICGHFGSSLLIALSHLRVLSLQCLGYLEYLLDIYLGYRM